MEIGNSKSDPRVIIFPAMTLEEVSDRQVYFLFSVSQVEDIIKEVSVYPVPFSPLYIEGITEWREHIMPVMSMEECLGMETMSIGGLRLLSTRLIIVRIHSFSQDKGRVMLRVAPTIRMISLPIPCTPISLSSVAWIPKKELIKAVYEWEEGYFLIVDMPSIFEI